MVYKAGGAAGGRRRGLDHGRLHDQRGRSVRRVRNTRRVGSPLVTLAAALALTAAATAAGAQEQPLSTAAPDPVGLSPPVVAGAPSAAHVDAARLGRSLTAGLSVQLATAMASRDPAHAQAMVAAVGDGLTSITPQLQAEAISRITRDFTLDQLREMLSFYQSPTGRLAARRMPLILQQTVGSVLGYLPQMMTGIEDSYCSRVKCSRAEKKAFDDVAARMAAAHPPAD